MKIFTYIKENSSRVPAKNFQTLGGVELWKHFLYKFTNWEVYVDTDSFDVLDECRSDPHLSHVTAYPRKQEFIDLEKDPQNKLSPSLLMVENFLDNYVGDGDEKIVLTHVTSPFLEEQTVMDAAAYLDKGYEVVHSVFPVQDFAWQGEDYIPLNFNPRVVERTQDVDNIYFSKGAFFIFTKNTFKKYGNRLGKKNFYYPLSLLESLEVDTPQDLEFAKIVYNGKE
jgi:CMP-N-acetylneuraminic acid synthetase